MWTLIVEGGFPMWFLLAFGLSGLVTAGRYAASPTRGRLMTVLGLGTTTLFSVLTGTAADLAAFGHGAATYLKAHPNLRMSEVVLLGIGESMSPGVLGFSILTIMALLVTLGLHRADNAI